MGYVMLYAESEQLLTENVNEKLQDGYKLVGGLSITYAGGETFMFAQALVKKS